MIPLDEVVEAIVTGIEHRASTIVAPRNNPVLARVPGLVHPLVDLIGFPGRTIPDAITLAGKDSNP